MGTISHDGGSKQLVAGRTIFDYADDLAVRVATSCGRAGTCHECVVEVTAGGEALGAPTDEERFLKEPFRLACQAVVEDDSSDITFAPLRRQPRILTSRSGGGHTDPLSDASDPPVVERDGGVWRGEERIDEFRGRMLGLAVDVGTTTVALELVDLASGQALQTRAFGSPQQFAGSDVMNRISYDGGEFRGELHDAIITSINSAVTDLVRDWGISRRQIYEVVIAGNSTMRDLVFGLDVQGLGQKPYQSIIEKELAAGARTTSAIDERASVLGMRLNPHARVYGMPLIGSHVGGDTAADILATDLTSQTAMLVDIGTNTEVVVRSGGRMLAASCPAGPAFEGGLVGFGMPAYTGAIESLRWDGGAFVFETIDDQPPQGICGSGLIDLLAELRSHDMMDTKGVFGHDRRASHIDVVPEHGITLSRLDASNLAQAKAANYCGQTIVCRELGIDPADVERLYLSGGFANYVNVDNAIAIGLLPPLPPERVTKVGNTSLQGAQEALLSLQKRAAIEATAATIEHIELEMAPDFFEVFVDGCRLEPMGAAANAGRRPSS